MDTDLEETRNNGFDAVVELIDSFVVGVAINTGNFGWFLAEATEEIFGLGDQLFGVGAGIIWNNDEEGFIHDVGFLG